MELEYSNIFEEEFEKVGGGRNYIVLSDVLKISLLDDNNEYKISFAHIHSNKDGKFTLQKFAKLSEIYLTKEKVYKRYEFKSQLQAHFTLLMWQQVCSPEGETLFCDWIKCLLVESQSDMSLDESEDEVNPDNSTYIERHTIKLFYDILNVKITHGLDFQYFFDLMQIVSEETNHSEDPNEVYDDYIHIDVVKYFCRNFIRGFSKLIIDLGFDTYLLEER